MNAAPMDDGPELAGALAPPTANGEVVFDAPWQSRVFAIAQVLCERGLYSWDEFRAQLIGAIGRWETQHAPTDPYPYFDCFLEALMRLLAERDVLAHAAVESLAAELGARPHGHDHHHGHDHDDRATTGHEHGGVHE